MAFGTSAIVLSPALVAAFLTFYGGFIILFLVACVGVVVSAAPMAPRPPGALPDSRPPLTLGVRKIIAPCSGIID